MLFIAYNGVLIPLRAAFPLYSLLARLRGVDADELRQRIGRRPNIASGKSRVRNGPDPGTSSIAPVWIQAASVGEVGVAASLIDALRREIPGVSVFLTTTTRTGQSLAHRRMGTLSEGIGYFPLDFPASVRRMVGALSPLALILVETEIWPNLLVEAGRRGLPVLIVNGRLSDRAFRYYRLAAPLFAVALSHVSLACLQTPLDAERFARLGLPRERIRITGNLKFATPAAATAYDTPGILSALGVDEKDELWVAGSTAEGEETAVLDAFTRLPPPVRGRRLLVIAPRHTDRFEAAAKIVAASGLPWTRRSDSSSHALASSPVGAVAERSSRGAGHRPPQGRASVVLLDTLGELPFLYAAATVAFVGGSLVPVGGHNIIEPAASGVAPVFGPHMQNFRETAARLLEAGGAFQVRNARELNDLFGRLASDEILRRSAGESAKRVVAENSRSLDATIREILPYLRSARASRA